jgi:hypothetical protein
MFKPISLFYTDGFWRKGNVEIVCNYHNIPFTDSLDDLLDKIIQK